VEKAEQLLKSLVKVLIEISLHEVLDKYSVITAPHRKVYLVTTRVMDEKLKISVVENLHLELLLFNIFNLNVI